MVGVEGLGWLGIRTERFEETARFFREVMGLEETRSERDVVGFVFPDGTEMEVWRPEDEFHSFFGVGPVVGFRVDDVEATRAQMEAAGVVFLGPVQRSQGPPGATSGARTATSTRLSTAAESAARRGFRAGRGPLARDYGTSVGGALLLPAGAPITRSGFVAALSLRPVRVASGGLAKDAGQDGDRDERDD